MMQARSTRAGPLAPRPTRRPRALHGKAIATESFGDAPRACAGARAAHATPIAMPSSGGAPRASAGAPVVAGHARRVVCAAAFVALAAPAL